MGQVGKAGMAMRAVQTQSMAMTPQLLQSIRMLQWSSLELEQELRQALGENLMLEAADDIEDDDVAPDQAEAEPIDPEAEVTGEDAGATARVEADYDWSSRDSWSGGEPVDEDGNTWEARVAAPAPTDPRVAALQQLELVIENEREARLIGVMLEAVDDNGYLTQPLEGIAMESGLQPVPDSLELNAALTKLQSVEPSGFGARDLSECLMLQLVDLPAGTPGLDLARQLIDDYLPRIAEHDFAHIGEELAVDAMDLHTALDLVLSLNPRPAVANVPVAEAIVPDVVVTGTRGAWRVSLNDARLPRVRINRSYERAVQSQAGHRALRDQLQEARWLVRGVEMRNDTLLRTAVAVFERQAEFLERGEEAMVSLTMREIAEAIGMHESTVCRVVNNKWAQTPWGVYELKAFFPSQIAGSQRQTSGTAVKAMIRRIIDAECPATPLCDGDITAILARHGIHVARRTVAKYREAMRIPQAKERVSGAKVIHLHTAAAAMAG